MRTLVHKKAIYILIAILLFLTILIYTLPAASFVRTHIYYHFRPDKSISCFKLQNEHTLSDITDSPIRKGKSIFFHETSCRSYYSGKIKILARQACAVESAARMNPNLDVYLTFSSPGIIKFEESESDRIIKKLTEYKNIKIRHLNYENYIKNTPLEGLYTDGVIESSNYAQSHASDVLRYLTLYKYGGIYLDTDVIVIRSLEDLKPNYAGIETDTNVAAGVISFDFKSLGHKYAQNCVDDLKHNFSTKGWGNNGPGVITRLSRNLCGVKLGKDMVHRNCRNFTVYPAYMFYPIPWEEWELYFNPDKISEVFRMAKNSYVLHVWNKHSETTKVPFGIKTPYTVFAEKFCPKVFKECDTEF